MSVWCFFMATGVTLNCVYAYGSNYRLRGGPFCPGGSWLSPQGGKPRSWAAQRIAPAVPAATWGRGLCWSFRSGLLETDFWMLNITEYEVILTRDRPRGWRVGLTNSERSDPSQSEGCPFITLQRGYWHTGPWAVRVGRLLGKSSVGDRGCPLPLVAWGVTGPAEHTPSPVRPLVQWHTVRVQSGWRERVALCLSLTLGSGPALRMRGGSQPVRAFGGRLRHAPGGQLWNVHPYIHPPRLYSKVSCAHPHCRVFFRLLL